MSRSARSASLHASKRFCVFLLVGERPSGKNSHGGSRSMARLRATRGRQVLTVSRRARDVETAILQPTRPVLRRRGRTGSWLPGPDAISVWVDCLAWLSVGSGRDGRTPDAPRQEAECDKGRSPMSGPVNATIIRLCKGPTRTAPGRVAWRTRSRLQAANPLLSQNTRRSPACRGLRNPVLISNVAPCSPSSHVANSLKNLCLRFPRRSSASDMEIRVGDFCAYWPHGAGKTTLIKHFVCGHRHAGKRGTVDGRRPRHHSRRRHHARS